MINWDESAKLNNTTIKKLKLRFIKYPQSNKLVCAICDKCNKIRNIEYYQYRKLCFSCTIKGKNNPFYGKKHSDENKEINRKKHLGVSVPKQKGGQDLVRHHYIYDHNDLSKYTMLITRSKHTKLHRMMQKVKIKVPHINL